MAATEGSVYQALRVQHIAGNPPNSDPQRSSETFASYVARMAGIYLNPDIDATESDSDYAVRLRSYVPAVPISYITASYAIAAQSEIGVQVSASYATSASYAVSATSAGTATSATTATTATTASFAITSSRAALATSASFATFAVTAVSASYAFSASYAPVV